MSLRDAATKIAGKLRHYPAASSVDVRTTAVTIRTRTWSGGRVGSGVETDVDVVLTPRPKVVEIAAREIAGAGGRYAVGDVRVGPITPSHAGGGYTKAQLAPTATENGTEILYVLAGHLDGNYVRIDLESHKTFSWFLVLRRRRE